MNLLKKWAASLLLFASASLWAIEPVNGVYQLGSAADLKAFAELVNGGNNAISAVMTSDIVADADQPMIGLTDATAFKGSFDGQGHTLTLNWTGDNALAKDPSGLFAYLAGPVSNLRLEGTIEAKAPRTGALAGRIVAAVTISNVISNVTMIGFYAGDSALSGLLGRPSTAGIIVQNCLYTGTMISDVSANVGAIIGWNATATTMINCAMLGTIKIKDLRSTYNLTNVDSNLLGRASGTLTAKNCYYLPSNLAQEDLDAGYINVNNTLAGSSAVTATQIESGELCFNLNGEGELAWYQTIGTDKYPVLDKTHGVVYLNGRVKCDGTPYDNAFFSNTDEGLTQDEHNYTDGVCTVCGAADPNFVNIAEDGFYELNKPSHLTWFASKVNGGNTDLKARLTASIDLKDTEWLPIGTKANPFKGTFDGQLYPITNINNMLFGTTAGAQITGVALESGEITATNTDYADHTGSIVGHSTTKEGSVTNSYSKVTIKGGNGDLGGIGGKYLGTMKNVAFAGTFDGGLGTWSMGGLAGSTNSTNTTFISDCFVFANWGDGLDPAYGARGGIVGWCHTNTPTNCYVIADTFTKLLGDGTGSTDNCEFVSEQAFASGEIAFKLGSDWHQTLGKDAYPVLDSKHGTVYQVGNTYSNVEGLGFKDGYYQIDSPKALAAFAALVSGGEVNANAVLTADIEEYTGPSITKDGSGNAYKGIFDGQFHTININMSSVGQNDGLFRAMGGTVKNLHVSGKYTATFNRIGVICGEIFGGTVENCWVSADIAADFNGDGAIAGIAGRASAAGSLIKNCVFSGNVTGAAHNCAGIVGWCPNVIDIQNCLVTGIFNTDHSQGNARPIARHADDSAGNVKCVNCFYVDANGSLNNAGATQVTIEQVKSGEVCFMLNTDQTSITMFQNLGVDAVPVPFNTHAQVYASGNMTCGGERLDDQIIYTNQAISLPDHTFVSGICSVCGKVDENWMQPNADGIYALATPTQLIWFAAMVNQGNKEINGLLTDDIDFSGFEDKFTPIGTSTNHYAGTFDGGQKTITLSFTATEASYGFFRFLDGTVRNLHMAGTYNAAFNKTGVICGELFGGLIENCWISTDIAAVYGGDAATAGIAGRGSRDGSIIRNCIVTSNFDAGETGTYNCAAIMGWAGSKTTIENCLFTGTIKADGVQGNPFVIARNPDNLTIKDTYFVNAYGGTNAGATQVTDEQVASGEVTYLLNKGNIQKPLWRQSVGYDAVPTFDAAHGIVNKIDATGYATQYIAENNVLIPEGVTAFTGFIDTPWIALRPLTNIIPAGEAVVLQGKAGFYSFIPVTVEATVGNNELKGTAEPLEATGSQYVLAEKEGKVGFYQATGTIPAGKAYIENVGPSVKGFFFEGTGIEMVQGFKGSKVQEIYDLSGRRVEKATKGLYIINGKKVMK